MAKKSVSVGEITDRFGGPAFLASQLPYLTRKMVGMWSVRGVIPGDWHIPLLRLARNTKIKLTEEELLSVGLRGRDA